MTRGRPLRFLVVVLAGWTTARVALLWPDAVAPRREPAKPPGGAQHSSETERTIVSHGAGQRPGKRAAVTTQLSQPAAGWSPLPIVVRLDTVRRIAGDLPSHRQAAPPTTTGRSEPVPAETSLTATPSSAVVETDPAVPTIAAVVPMSGASPPQRPAPRLAGSTWLIVRPAGGDNLAFGQLGGSQGGVRATYALDGRRRLALSGRLSAPLHGHGREAAPGIDWQPTRWPVHLLVEERVPLDGGTARPAAQLIAGGERRLVLGLTVDGYAQAGGVHRRGGFADGAAHLVRPLFTRRILRVDAGAGAWGAIQRGVSRVDLGPTLGVTLPAQGGTVRLAVDYRFRTAGRARPGSGPALSLGSGF